MKRNDRNIEEVLDHSLPSASKEQTEAACDRVFSRLMSNAAMDRDVVAKEPVVDLSPARAFGWRWVSVMTAVAALLVAAVWVGVAWQSRGADAVLKSPDGGLYRIVEGNVQTIRLGETLKKGETVRTNGAAGAVLALADGSRVEMRSRSELGLQTAEDGMLLRLNDGSIIVTAAKQRTGHLYVRTKDVTVSVVGTVFLVNAEEAGSRVAVIQGEVRVQQGATQKTLLPGEQVASGPSMLVVPLIEEISWSRNIQTHLALLQQFTAPIPVQKPPEPHEAFEVASVRPTNSAPGGERGLNGGGRSVRPAGEPCGSESRFPQIDPRRFAATDTTLLALILWAYGKDCSIWRGSDYLSGGPEWIKSDGFDIEALIPEGTPGYTREQFRNGLAPELQRMLQTLLANRFKLVVRRETREVPAYALTIGSGGPRLRAWKEGEGKSLAITGRNQDGQISSIIRGNKQSMAVLAKWLGEATHRPVLDRTGLTGEFNFTLEFAPLFTDGPMFMANPSGTPSGPSLFTVIEELGLKLEPARAPAEFLTIEHAEKPSEN